MDYEIDEYNYHSIDRVNRIILNNKNFLSFNWIEINSSISTPELRQYQILYQRNIIHTLNLSDDVRCVVIWGDHLIPISSDITLTSIKQIKYYSRTVIYALGV